MFTCNGWCSQLPTSCWRYGGTGIDFIFISRPSGSIGKTCLELVFQKPGYLSTHCSVVNCLFQSYLMASSICYLKIISKVEKQCRLGIRTFWIFLVFWLVMRMLWRCISYVLAFHDKPAVPFLINEKWSSVKQRQMSYLRKKSGDKDVFVWTWTNNPMIEFLSGCFLKDPHRLSRGTWDMNWNTVMQSSVLSLN